MLHIHMSHSPISSEEIFKVPGPRARGEAAHVEPCATAVTVALALIVARHPALVGGEARGEVEPGGGETGWTGPAASICWCGSTVDV
jgi:hypothetical protein